MNAKGRSGGIAALRALIVEDNEHMRMLLRTLLQAMGVRDVLEYSDAALALAQLPGHHPDFILSDLSMAPMDGLAFVRTIRKSEDPMLSVLPIIMVTGHTERRRVEAARDCGVTEILAKPITASGLFQRIEEIVYRPRPFVRNETFFGPCRRRHAPGDYTGPFRRKDDAGVNLDEMDRSRARA